MMTDKEAEQQVNETLEKRVKEVGAYIDEYKAFFGSSKPMETVTNIIAGAALQAICQNNYLCMVDSNFSQKTFAVAMVDAMFFGCYMSLRGDADLTLLRKKQM